MKHRFNQVGITPIFSEGTDYTGPPQTGIDTRNWSIMLSHISILKQFCETNKDYCVVCEDDIHIHKDFSILVDDCIFNMEYYNMEIVLLGYLIDGLPYPGDRIVSSINQKQLIHFYKYHESIWGAHCYLIKRCYAEHMLKYFSEPVYDIPYSPDWIITKLTGKRSFVWPPLAIEEGDVATQDQSQRDFHKRCNQFQFENVKRTLYC
jgi:GR25 family glycosyltransferase involved in LPS biosynthesis